MALKFLQHVQTDHFLDTLVSLVVAFVLGGLIGFERQYRQRTAGLRTNVLVALGAAIFVDIAVALNGSDGAVRVIAYVVSGIGFLGAGVIMREEGNIHGLNTAATLWCSAAIGAAAGADLIIEALLATGFILAANILLRPIGHAIDRRPLDDDTELLNVIYIICGRQFSKLVMDKLDQALMQYHYPPQDIEVEPFGDEDVEIAATLIATSTNSEDINHIIQLLNDMPEVRHAYLDKNSLA
ncbi:MULTISPECIES: MgtC/SapB family protein [unclassified Acinetobacter]|uniref:MgtC/SapB family protein n=1 Tax=unclassified Acinetobacter TaxID=196816 RepID=UPI0029343935|nr:MULTISPECIES: MgtC/SapB family protein [unclassified Acinetobacter]WOE32343.1 MgtC/SapB family protein [Acinetobacter sp. SAAs470]WOE37816.1 MgtC/SapB family protein [Acinetobacter sp. SAAs474]